MKPLLPAARQIWLAVAAVATVLPGASPGADTNSLPPPATVSAAATNAASRWNFHAQSTAVAQGDLPFPAAYSGPNSLRSRGELKETWSVDVMGGARLWRGAEAYVDGLLWQGFGLSDALGVAGFPNGEAFRKGTRAPNFTLARVFVRQSVSLGGDEEQVEDAAFQLAGPRPRSRLTVTAGKLSAKDFFDTNAYANDARGQFLNWSLMANGAWDYPADALGYAPGAVVEIQAGPWAVRSGVFAVMSAANGVAVDQDFRNARAMVGELERRFTLRQHPGAVRLLAFLSQAHMRRFADAIASPSLLNDPSLPHPYGQKYGFGLNLEQELTRDLGAFLRLGWNDGRAETWMFTDIDRTASVGLALKGTAWGRAQDTVGGAGVWNEISGAHRAFLAAGGLGITAGDGRLNYGPEQIGEFYYDWQFRSRVHCTADCQFVNHPAYNRDRGPVPLFALRLHWEY